MGTVAGFAISAPSAMREKQAAAQKV